VSGPDWTPRCDTTHRVPAERRAGGALTAPERDSILREARARREAWRARRISDYRVRVAVGCFCPWPSTPAILEGSNGVPKTLWDTLGRAKRKLGEPWSVYTIEATFDAIERSATTDDVLEVAYDRCLGYPTSLRGIARLGLPDNWFWVKLAQLTRSR
jgi:hypothetical protein